MSATSVVHPSHNGHSPAPIPLTAVSLVWLGEAIDRLAGLRAQKRRPETAERELTKTVLAHMTEHGLPVLRASLAVATVVPRTDLAVDPELFVTAVGLSTAAPALRVLVEQARVVLGQADLAAISEAVTSPTLRVEPLRALAEAGR